MLWRNTKGGHFSKPDQFWISSDGKYFVWYFTDELPFWHAAPVVHASTVAGYLSVQVHMPHLTEKAKSRDAAMRLCTEHKHAVA